MICALGEFAQCKVGEKAWKMNISVKVFSLWETNKECCSQFSMDTEVTKLLNLHEKISFVFSNNQNHIKLENMMKL